MKDAEQVHYEIRKASIDDLEVVADLFNLYRFFYRQSLDYDKAKKFIHDRLTESQSHIFVAYMDNKAVGFVQLYELFHYLKLKKQWLLSDLYVRSEYRGKGLSVALINRSKQWCDETGACGLMLDTEKTNDIGNQLYPKCGFEYDGGHNYYHWWK